MSAEPGDGVAADGDDAETALPGMVGHPLHQCAGDAAAAQSRRGFDMVDHQAVAIAAVVSDATT